MPAPMAHYALTGPACKHRTGCRTRCAVFPCAQLACTAYTVAPRPRCPPAPPLGCGGGPLLWCPLVLAPAADSETTLPRRAAGRGAGTTAIHCSRGLISGATAQAGLAAPALARWAAGLPPQPPLEGRAVGGAALPARCHRLQLSTPDQPTAAQGPCVLERAPGEAEPLLGLMAADPA